MIISDEQVRRAAEYLQRPESRQSKAMIDGCPHDCPPELVERVMQKMTSEPDIREDRVKSALDSLASGPQSSAEVAAKMIGRIISDSIR